MWADVVAFVEPHSSPCNSVYLSGDEAFTFLKLLLTIRVFTLKLRPGASLDNVGAIEIRQFQLKLQGGEVDEGLYFNFLKLMDVRSLGSTF